MPKIIEHIRLTFQNEKSDKEYQLQIEENNKKYNVVAFYGKRGSNLKPAVKKENVSLEESKKAFQAIVQEKINDHYVCDTPTLDTSDVVRAIERIKDKRDTGLRPQLLNAITSNEIERYIQNNNFCAEKKYDGERLLCRKIDRENIIFANRKGQHIPGNREIEKMLLGFLGTFELDGEIVEGKYYIFDIFEYNGENCKNLSYKERMKKRNILIDNENKICISIQTHYTELEKRALVSQAIEEGWEGVVFKKIDAPFEAGRPNSYGNQLKYKLWEEASCIVTKHNNIDSIQVSLYENNQLQFLGNVKCSKKPPIGSIVDIRYLYVVGKGGLLVQSKYKSIRTDIDPQECTTHQLKYKKL